MEYNERFDPRPVTRELARLIPVARCEVATFSRAYTLTFFHTHFTGPDICPPRTYAVPISGLELWGFWLGFRARGYS